MNYFELMQLPVTLKVDKAEARRKYLELSRQHHPDYFVNNDQQSQDNALEMSALLNKALKTFGSVDETIAYVLKLKGLLEEEEKYSLSPGFLMEMMEFNEEVAEAETPDQKQQLHQKLLNLEKEIYEPVAHIVEHYQEGVTSQEELLQVKDYHFRKKYLQRLHQQLGGML